jgi:hypothetical protein
MLDLLGIPTLWQGVVDYFTVSPFWHYLFWGVVISLGAAALAWLFPVLRSLSGAVILAIAGMLYAYRKGETDAQRRERERQARARQRQARQQQQQTNDPWRWW